jgi:hypothetical protein
MAWFLSLFRLLFFKMLVLARALRGISGICHSGKKDPHIRVWLVFSTAGWGMYGPEKSPVSGPVRVIIWHRKRANSGKRGEYIVYFPREL